MTSETDLPGFRFHPTEEELLDFYLRNTILGKKSSFDVIGLLNIYRHDPRELPGLAKIHGEREWYFFVPRDRKHGCTGRPNRTTETGFWKATGSDRKILKPSYPKNVIGLRKTLVFYKGRAPRGNKTDWIMNEYRLPDDSPLPKEMVLCKIYRKATSMKVLEQRAAAMEEEEEEEIMEMKKKILKPSSSPVDQTVSFSCSLNAKSPSADSILQKKKELLGVESGEFMKKKKPITTNSVRLPSSYGDDDHQLPQLQLPRLTTEWDNFWSQLNSPWFHSLIVSPSLINF